MNRIPRTDRTDRYGTHRRGAISAMAVVVLVVVSLLVTQYVRRALNDRRHTRTEIDQLQAESLAKAGLSIAQSAIKNDPAWTGIEWKLSAGAIDKTKTGEVKISVANGVCTVTARYPANGAIPVQVTRRKLILPRSDD